MLEIPNLPIPAADPEKKILINSLLANKIDAKALSRLADMVDAEDLAYIIQQIYDLNQIDILALAALTPPMRAFDVSKNDRRNARFTKQIRKGFQKTKIISWYW